MDWVERFYSKTGTWWGAAEAVVNDMDRRRAALVLEAAGRDATLLELGCGYGNTAIACAETGVDVVAIDVSARIRFATATADGNPRWVAGDFYDADVGGPFDVVAYWDGFGVGTDNDQRRLLRRVATEWLTPGGVALIDVYDPAWWSQRAGFEETKQARPDASYPFSLGHRQSFDVNACRALDSWWELESNEIFTQSLRCYRPDDLSELVTGTGLHVEDVDESSGQSPSFLVRLRRSATQR